MACDLAHRVALVACELETLAIDHHPRTQDCDQRDRRRAERPTWSVRHPLAVAQASGHWIGRKERERRSYGQERFTSTKASRGGVARPGPLLRSLAETTAHRVQRDVAKHLPPVLVIADQSVAVAALEQVSDAPVCAVEPVCVGTVQPLHPLCEVRF